MIMRRALSILAVMALMTEGNQKWPNVTTVHTTRTEENQKWLNKL